jgi:hypothetical protein
MLLLAGSIAAAQDASLPSSQGTDFMGTWEFTLTEPFGFHETVRIWDKEGTVAASVQAEQQFVQTVSKIFKDGDMLLLTLTRFEDGEPTWAVIALTLDGDTMQMAQMLERSIAIKRGTGRRQGN